MQVLYRFSVIFLVMNTLFLSCTKSHKEDIPGNRPAPGSTKMFTVPVTYYIKDYSTANSGDWATYPVAAFAEDENAVKYTVKFHSFKKPSSQEGKLLSWVPGQLPPANYHPRPELGDLIEGVYQIACGATWCHGGVGGNCNNMRGLEYQNFYETNYGGKADIIIQY